MFPVNASIGVITASAQNSGGKPDSFSIAVTLFINILFVFLTRRFVLCKWVELRDVIEGRS